MKKLAILILMIIAVQVNGQTKKPHSQMQVDCSTCHSCENPTKLDPCLNACPRLEMVTVHQSAAKAPDVIKLNKFKNTSFEDNYKPVQFSHLLHAEMADMAGGCESCHHYNPPGDIMACSDCHEAERKREDVSKPDLKGAFHQQCMSCHREWNSNTQCSDCHLLNSEIAEGKVPGKTVKKGGVHPPVTTPVKVVYETGSDEGDLVTFFHSEHTGLFGLECTSCHTNQGCVTCHNTREGIEVSMFGDDDAHSKCRDCHDTEDNCESCHSDETREPFNHAVRTGFNLTKYHSNAACIQCHKAEGKFTGLTGNCFNCHGDWEDGDFEHSVTGLELDDIHIDNACEDCHTTGDLRDKPTCDNCHDEISYPDDLPGERVK